MKLSRSARRWILLAAAPAAAIGCQLFSSIGDLQIVGSLADGGGTGDDSSSGGNPGGNDGSTQASDASSDATAQDATSDASGDATAQDAANDASRDGASDAAIDASRDGATDASDSGSTGPLCGTSADCVANGGNCVASHCTTPPSCAGAANDCGALGNENCCKSPLVPAGNFNEGNGGNNMQPGTAANLPASVSAFRLDRFEVTVRRFRTFAAAYAPATMVANGAGAHPGSAISGWNTGTYPALVPADKAALETAVGSCMGATYTPAAGASDDLPVNCVTYLEALLFCAWDGGRLASFNEWEYAAVGGMEQRYFPWSNPPASTALNGTHLVYNTGAPLPVGSRPSGDAKWGQADMAGNVAEHNYDTHSGGAANPCIDCVVYFEAGGSGHNLLGGNYTIPSGVDFVFHPAVNYDGTLYYFNAGPAQFTPNPESRTTRDRDRGIRCVKPAN